MILTRANLCPISRPSELAAAAQQARKNGATQLGSADALAERTSTILKSRFFDPNFQPMLTVKNPPERRRILWRRAP